MKKVIAVIALMIVSLCTHAQVEAEIDNRYFTHYGFSIGINRSFLNGNDRLPIPATIQNDFGLRLGLIAERRISDLFLISPKAALSFNNNELTYFYPFGSTSEQEVMPVHLEFATHLVLQNQCSSITPYLSFGPSLRVPVGESEGTVIDPVKPHFAFDLGVGLVNTLDFFLFTPELRFSYGLKNIGNYPIPNLYYHQLSFILNFKG